MTTDPPSADTPAAPPAKAPPGPARQPIVAVLGHVDHGKTTLLDRIRGTRVAAREAGGITQHIGATEIPLHAIRRVCGPLMAGKQFDVPGLLFIDTPGHRAFTTLRRRGGALADLAVLVVDAREGLMPQTVESLRILRQHRTPFVVAANKIDRLDGFDLPDDTPFVTGLAQLQERVIQEVDGCVYRLVEGLDVEGFHSERYDRLRDFARNIAIVPVSAKTGVGIADLLLVLTGLAHRFLQDELRWDPAGPARGTIVEVKEARGLGPCLDVIVHDGTLRVGDAIVVGGHDEPFATTVKALLRPAEMQEIRATTHFLRQDAVTAAAGVRVAAPGADRAVAGGPLVAVGPGMDVEAVKEELRRETAVEIPLDDDGFVIKADTLGSLEGLASELRESGHHVTSAAVGDVSKRDVVSAATLPSERRVILAFNVRVLEDAAEEARQQGVHVVLGDILYRLVEELAEWQEARKKAEAAKQRKDLVFPGKLLFLSDHVFRASKPAIVGMRVLAGRVRPGQRLLREDGQALGRIRSLRTGETALQEAKQGEEIAVAIDAVTVGRQLKEGTFLVDIPEADFRELRTMDLTLDEKDVMEQVARTKRQTAGPFWGM